MKKLGIGVILIVVINLIPTSTLSEIISVNIKGMDDGNKSSRQHDYMEAVMNAKLQAIERAGVEISSFTQVENFQLRYDMIESKASAALMPGFEVIDIGYTADGTYQVVLIGKVKTKPKQEAADDIGYKRLSFKDLKGSYVNAEKEGKLFVVKGFVTNNYPDTRRFIRIRSNILDSKGKVVKSKIGYAGNPISDNRLQSLCMEEINNQLLNKFGVNKMNINILPNSSIPFMIIFSELPEDISEFTIEAIGSSPEDMTGRLR